MAGFRPTPAPAPAQAPAPTLTPVNGHGNGNGSFRHIHDIALGMLERDLLENEKMRKRVDE